MLAQRPVCGGQLLTPLPLLSQREGFREMAALLNLRDSVLTRTVRVLLFLTRSWRWLHHSWQ